jgi:hypothetical protein
VGQQPVSDVPSAADPSPAPEAALTLGPMASEPRASRAATTATRPPTTIPESGSGRFRVETGESAATGIGELLTYSVEVEEGLPIEPSSIARTVETVLADERGWIAVDPRSLQRVEHDPDVRIRLATPETADRLCVPLDTGGRLSCRNGENVVLNAWRWVNGADSYGGDLVAYRRYMINHEFGHALGNGHVSCPASGSLAPVMLQQTKGLDGCRPNPWPARGPEPSMNGH